MIKKYFIFLEFFISLKNAYFYNIIQINVKISLIFIIKMIFIFSIIKPTKWSFIYLFKKRGKKFYIRNNFNLILFYYYKIKKS